MEYRNNYSTKYLSMMKSKIGLFKSDENDAALLGRLEDNLQLTETDMTLFFRNLNRISKDRPINEDFLAPVMDAFYLPQDIKGDILESWRLWFTDYIHRLQKESIDDRQRAEKMNNVNPKYVLRNYMAQLAIDAADEGDYSLLDEFFELLKNPYAEQPEAEKWFAKRPEWARHKVGCSMLSCSS
jgi:uncharacterized protein YdiU (UPF0061 family)